jgi:hypothetical protein
MQLSRLWRQPLTSTKTEIVKDLVIVIYFVVSFGCLWYAFGWVAAVGLVCLVESAQKSLENYIAHRGIQ